jgi:chromosome segregation ATPase
MMEELMETREYEPQSNPDYQHEMETLLNTISTLEVYKNERDTLRSEISQLRIQIQIKDAEVMEALAPTKQSILETFQRGQQELQEMEHGKLLIQQISFEKKSLEDKLFEKEKLISKLEESAKALIAELNSCKEEMEMNTIHHQSTLDLVEKYKQQLDQQNEQNVLNATFYQQKEVENTLYKNEIERIGKSLMDSKKNEKDVKTSLVTLEHQMNLMKEEYNTLNSTIVGERNDFFLKLNEKQEDLQYVNKMLSDMEHSHQLLYEKHVQVEMELVNRTSHLNELENTCQELHRLYETTCREGRGDQEENNTLKLQLAELERSIVLLGREKEECNGVLIGLEHQKLELVSRLEESTKGRNQLETQLKEACDRIILLESKEDLSMSINEWKHLYTTSQQQVHHLKSLVEEANTKYSSLWSSQKDSLQEVNTRTTLLQEALNVKECEFKELIQTHNSELDQLGNKIMELRTKRNEYQASLASEEKLKLEALNSISALESTISTLEQTLVDSNTRMDNVQQLLEEAISTKQHYQLEVEKLNQTILQMKQEGIAKEMQFQDIIRESSEQAIKWSDINQVLTSELEEEKKEKLRLKSVASSIQTTCDSIQLEYETLQTKWEETCRNHSSTLDQLDLVKKELERERTDYTNRPIFSNQLNKEKSIANQYKQRVTLLESCLLNQDTSSTLDDFNPETYISGLMTRSKEIHGKREAERVEDKKRVVELKKENIEQKASLSEMAKIVHDQKIALKQQEEALLEVKTKYTKLKRKCEESSNSRKKRKEDEKPNETTQPTDVPPLKKKNSLMSLLDADESGFPKIKKMSNKLSGMFQSKQEE